MPAVMEPDVSTRLPRSEPQLRPLLVRRRELLTARLQQARPPLGAPQLVPVEHGNAGWYAFLLTGLAAGLGLLAYTLEFLARVGR